MLRAARLGRLTPLALRLSTLGLRFVLIFFLARYLPIEAVAHYGLLVASISYAVFPLGFDFYTYSNRELLRGERSRWRSMMRSQALFHACLYAVIGPALLLLFASGLMPWWLAAWFFLLLPLEHLGLELDRLLIAMSDQLGASVSLFLRQGATSLAIVPALAFVPGYRSLSVVLGLWLAMDALGCLVGFLCVARRVRGEAPGRLDLAWVRRGMKVAVPFLVGTLCLRALFTVDRQVVKVWASVETLGAYTFYATVAAGMTSVVYAGVHQFAYPRLVKAAHARDKRSFARAFRSLALQTAVAVGVGVGVGVLLRPIIVSFVGGGVYERLDWLLPVLLAVTALYNLSLVPHYALYALEADRTILSVTVLAFSAFLVSLLLLVRADALIAVVVGVAAASLTLGIGKLVPAVRGLRAMPVTTAANG